MDGERKKVLICNDDGVSAPGLQALVKGINRECICDIYICGPFGERSAQSNAISLGKTIHAFEISVEGSIEAFAVDGTPADSIVVATRSSLMSTKDFDLVVSGINRGDNVGSHVVYSGTVGAAREANFAGYPAIAFSIDDHSARSEEQYNMAVLYACGIIRGYLAMGAVEKEMLKKVVLNVNVPGGNSIKGIHLCRQGRHNSTSDMVEVDGDINYVEKNSHKDQSIHMGDVTIRGYKYQNLKVEFDKTPGTDHFLLSQGWCTVTALDSFMDIPISPEDVDGRYNPDLVATIRELVRRSASAISSDCIAIVE